MNVECNEADERVILAALNTLAEHFDSVHIFCTRYNTGTEGETDSFNKGRGNWYTRYGPNLLLGQT